MIQQKLLVDQLRLGYNGILKIDDFLNTTEDWKSDHHMDKEIKKIGHFVTPSGKQYEWFVELWKKPEEYAKQVLRVRALFNNIVNIDIQRGKYITTMDQAKCLIIFDSYLESELDHRWQSKPLHHFFRGVVDKIVWKYYTNRFEDELIKLTYDLFGTLQQFFKRYRT